MPGIVRAGDPCSGHGCWPPRANGGASGNVCVNGRGAHRKGDAWGPHTCPDIPETHAGTASSGSASVFINGKAVCRIGDAISCGSTMAAGSGNVLAG